MKAASVANYLLQPSISMISIAVPNIVVFCNKFPVTLKSQGFNTERLIAAAKAESFNSLLSGEQVKSLLGPTVFNYLLRDLCEDVNQRELLARELTRASCLKKRIIR